MKKYDPIGWFITRHLAHKCIFLRSDSNSAYFFTSIGRGGIFSSSESLIHEKNNFLTDLCHIVDRILRTNVKIIVHIGIYNLCLRVSVPAGAFFG